MIKTGKYLKMSNGALVDVRKITAVESIDSIHNKLNELGTSIEVDIHYHILLSNQKIKVSSKITIDYFDSQEINADKIKKAYTDLTLERNELVDLICEGK